MKVIDYIYKRQIYRVFILFLRQHKCLERYFERFKSDIPTENYFKSFFYTTKPSNYISSAFSWDDVRYWSTLDRWWRNCIKI